VCHRRCLIDELGHLDTERPPSCARAQHACRACSCAGRPRSGGVPLSRFGDLRPPSGSPGLGIDLNRTPSTGCGTPAALKKPRRMCTANMTWAVNLFDEMSAPTDEVMAHPSCQLA
jgi:hypothetical protein